MSIENTKDALAIRARRVPEGHGALIAQIPDLSQKGSAPRSLGKPVDVRSISRALSLHLVFGVTLGLLVGVALPFVFGKASQPNPPVAEPPTWLGNSGINNVGCGNVAQTPAVNLVASAPERASDTRSSNSVSAGGDRTASWPAAPTWLCPPSAAIDTVFLSQTLNDMTIPPQSPTNLNRDTDARYDDGSGNPFRTTVARRDGRRPDLNSTWPDVASRARPSDMPGPAAVHRIPKPDVAGESKTAVSPGRNSYDPAPSSTH